ncbi:MAG: hypothetical protein RR812_04175, partial [Vagococcus sp.]
DTTRGNFVQVVCIWTLSEFKPTELKKQLIKVTETASTQENAAGTEEVSANAEEILATMEEFTANIYELEKIANSLKKQANSFNI